jgi:hypothetical protein
VGNFRQFFKNILDKDYFITNSMFFEKNDQKGILKKPEFASTAYKFQRFFTVKI